MIVIPFQRTRGSFEWSDKHHTCVGWVSSHCQTGAESTAVFSILANKSLKHWGRATVGAVLAKKFADRYSCLMWFLMWCGEIFPEIVQTPQVHQVIQFHSVYCYGHIKLNAWGKKGCRNFGRKRNQNLLLQVISGILLLSLYFVNTTSYADTHTGCRS